MINKEFKKGKYGDAFVSQLVSLMVTLILALALFQPSNAIADEVRGYCRGAPLTSNITTKNECLDYYIKRQTEFFLKVDKIETHPNGVYSFRIWSKYEGVDSYGIPWSQTVGDMHYWDPEELCSPPYKANSESRCVLDCPHGLQAGSSDQCAPKPPAKEKLNRAGGGSCTNTENPVNIATGNKFFSITDYRDNSTPLLKLTRTYDSADGLWAFNFSLSLTSQADADSYVLTFADGSQGSFVKQDEKWVRYENKMQEYLTQESGQLVYHGSANHKAVFNSSGQVISEQRGSNKLHYSYAENGNVTMTDPVRSRSLTVTFDAQLRTAGIILPSQKQISYLYDTQGRLMTVNNQGKETTYLYDNSALPNAVTKILDANDKVFKEITYYPDGRVKSSALNAGSEIMTFEYPVADTTLTTNALGKQTTYSFIDIKGVKKVKTVEGHATASCLAANQKYEYYDNGLLRSKTDWKGIATEFIYNERGLEIQRTEAVGTPQQRIISTTWHPIFNLPETVTIGSQVTIYRYDANGLLTAKSVAKI